jgi:hypothetical protein
LLSSHPPLPTPQPINPKARIKDIHYAQYIYVQETDTVEEGVISVRELKFCRGPN